MRLEPLIAKKFEMKGSEKSRQSLLDIQMSKWDKLLLRICSLSRDLRFDELRKVLESYGYKMNAPRGGSSHYTFRKSGCQPITIPKHEPIKKVYVELVRQVVESEARNDEDTE